MLRRVVLVRTDVSEAPSSSEMSVLTRATQRNIPEDTILHVMTVLCVQNIVHILIGNGIQVYLMSVQAADCNTDHYLVVAKVRERLAVNKQSMHRFHLEMFNL
jgi:hypothetical protein